MPTWSNTPVFDHVGFCFGGQQRRGMVATAKERTGHKPKSVTVVLSEGTLVITLHEALAPAERALARTPAGAAQMQEFHRQLFATSSVVCDHYGVMR